MLRRFYFEAHIHPVNGSVNEELVGIRSTVMFILVSAVCVCTD